MVERLLSQPKDFTWDELIKVLSHFGYVEKRSGKTGGSRRKFVDADLNIISLHKPHPSNVVKGYALNDIIDNLREKRKLEGYE